MCCSGVDDRDIVYQFGTLNPHEVKIGKIASSFDYVVSLVVFAYISSVYNYQSYV